MYYTFNEKVKQKYRRITKTHKLLKAPAYLCLVIALSGYYIGRYFTGNWKRFSCIGVAGIFFLVSASFCSPMLGASAAASVLDDLENTVYDSDLSLAAETQVSETAQENIDDADVMEGYSEHDMTEVSRNEMYSADEILEADTFAEQGNTISGDSMEESVPKTEGIPTFQSDDWKLVLINKQHPILDDYSFNLGTITGSMQCDSRIIDELLAMLQAAKQDGVDLVICSPYRDLNRQEVLFGRKITTYMNRGMSYMEAYATASQAVTVPGASEHQIGLALDIISNTYSSLNAGFGDTEAGKWLAAHSCEYGFILRYPLGKEYITSIEYEPWHFRYVGKDAATIITRDGITLEEFWDKYL